MKNRIYYIFLLFLFTGCKSDVSFLNYFFKELEKESAFEESDLDKTAKLSGDSLFLMLPKFKKIYLSLAKEHKCENYLFDLINDNSVKFTPDLRECIMLKSFQKFLNHEKIDLKKIQFSIQKRWGGYKIDSKLSVNEQRDLIDIININNDTNFLLDTIDLYFPLELKDDGSWNIFYCIYPLSLACSRRDGRLKMKGILKEKFYSLYVDGIETDKIEDPINLFFEIEILDLNKKNVFHFGKKLNKGNKFILSLELYANTIN